MFDRSRITQTIAEENELRRAWHKPDLAHALDVVGRAGIDGEAVIAEVARLSIAAPSWAVGTGGTRFGRFPGGGEPRDTYEKIDDIAAVNALTGANRTVSLHVPWDDPGDEAPTLRRHTAERGIGFDAMNSNTFQDNPSTTDGGKVSYKFGSLANVDEGARRAAIEHNHYVIDLGVALGARAITVWLADGTNHPGQASFRRQFERVLDGLRQIYAHLPDDWQLYTEHKPYEPAFYSSVVSDWGSSLLLAQGTGDRAKCLVDLGHHLPNANIEQVVSRLAMVGRLGGFHFNDSKYGDDDLTVGSIKPFELFLIFLELLEAGGGRMPDAAYMIDESHNLKDPLEDLLQATETVQHTLALALCVNQPDLRAAQQANDPARATEVLHRAFRTDVRPLVAEARRRNGAALDPLATYRAAGYRAATIAERGADSVATGL
ncbi:MAG TPA: TIM barrel protein [Acidimicrobiales bacterium]|nr:TIM barrel protein [Acidimicrobiales bacterium]